MTDFSSKRVGILTWPVWLALPCWRFQSRFVLFAWVGVAPRKRDVHRSDEERAGLHVLI